MGVCEPWPIVWPNERGADEFSAAVADAAVSAATAQLWAFSGGVYGVCSHTEQYRPACSGGCVGPYKGTDGQWRNGVGDASMCCRITLDHAPVISVESVLADGVALTSLQYAIGAGGVLRRRGACWPCVADCDDPPVTVSYTAGRRVSLAGALALGELAYEYAVGLTGGACRLPENAVNVTRQGVSVQLADQTAQLNMRRLGLKFVDAWLDSVNPNRLTSRSRVYSPDVSLRA